MQNVYTITITRAWLALGNHVAFVLPRSTATRMGVPRTIDGIVKAERAAFSLATTAAVRQFCRRC